MRTSNMIEIRISDKAYENDIYPLVKAFYPKHSIRTIGMDATDTNEKEQCIQLSIEFLEQQVVITLVTPEGKKVKKDFDLSLAIESKSIYKNILKRALYQLLSIETGCELPWGILTGIRPTKLVYEMLEKKWSEEAIVQTMKTEYLCSNEKLDLSIEIAKRELTILNEIDYKNGYSLYIGIPFCPSTCLYCSFTSYSITKFADYVEPYLQALKKEMEYAANCLPGRKLTTVYLGGGTPTTLSADQMDWLLGHIKQYFDFTYVKEFCVEAGRPDSITKDKLLVLKKWGVDRISINPQTMQQRTLDLIGRQHTVDQIKETVAMAREVGHNNINMDIIIGLPGEDPEDVKDTLNQMKSLDPESLTVHTLALKRAARLNIEKDQYADLEASQVSTMLEETIKFTKEQGYLPYYLYRQKNMAENLENVGYGKYGFEGIYNILIMEEKQTILALGAGGMSKFVFQEEGRLERVDNVKSVTDYINRIDEMIKRKQDFIQQEYLVRINKEVRGKDDTFKEV